MRKVSRQRLAIAVLAALGGAFAGGQASATTLDVRLEGVRSGQGRVTLCLWDAPETFPDCRKSRPLRSVTRAASPGSLTVRFADLAPGTYAVSVLHDENGNGAMDTGWLGIPREGGAASRITRVIYRAPRYSEASFRLDGDMQLTLPMFYPPNLP